MGEGITEKGYWRSDNAEGIGDKGEGIREKDKGEERKEK